MREERPQTLDGVLSLAKWELEALFSWGWGWQVTALSSRLLAATTVGIGCISVVSAGRVLSTSLTCSN